MQLADSSLSAFPFPPPNPTRSFTLLPIDVSEAKRTMAIMAVARDTERNWVRVRFIFILRREGLPPSLSLFIECLSESAFGRVFGFDSGGVIFRFQVRRCFGVGEQTPGLIFLFSTPVVRHCVFVFLFFWRETKRQVRRRQNYPNF